jgi:hypothetical protein
MLAAVQVGASLGWKEVALRAIALGALALLLWAPAPASRAAVASSAESTRRAEVSVPAEPLSPWSALDEEIERLVARGELPLEAWVFRPVDRGELAAWLRASAPSSARGGESIARQRLAAHLRWDAETWLTRAGTEPGERRPGSLISYCAGERQLHIAPYVRLMPTLRDGKEAAWTDSSRVGVRGVFYSGSTWVISAGLFAAEVAGGRRFADPLLAGTDFILHEEQLTVSARAGMLRLRAGRDWHRWGPGVSGTLLLSDDGAPFNFVEYQLRLGKALRFLALSGATSYHQRRYLAAHRLTWTPLPELSLSFAEGARYEANAPHLLYALGCMPYTLIERLDLQDNLSDPTRDAQRNNVLWSFDAVWRLHTGWLLYAELLADDIATESSDMPTRGGYQVGMTWAPLWRGWDWTLGAEYTRVSNYTYSVYYQDLCKCDWEHQGRPVGYAYGPDVAVLLLRVAVAPMRAWGGGAWLRYAAKGSGEIGRPWVPTASGCQVDEDPDCGPVSAWSLSGSIARDMLLGIAAHYRPGPLLRCGVWCEVQRTRRGNPEPRTSEWHSRLGITVSLGAH